MTIRTQNLSFKGTLLFRIEADHAYMSYYNPGPKLHVTAILKNKLNHYLMQTFNFDSPFYFNFVIYPSSQKLLCEIRDKINDAKQYRESLHAFMQIAKGMKNDH